MKKVTLLLFMFLISMSTFAQLPVEGFESWPPSGWMIINNAGPNVTWGQSALGNTNQPPYEGNHAAFLDRENVATGTTDDWLITPQFTVPANPQLRFFSRLTIGGNSGNIYQIRISSNADQAAQGNYTIIQTWNENEINPVQQEYIQKVVNIPASYVGQQVYIAFVMLSDFGDRWLIDNVSVVTQCLDPTTLTASNFTQTSADLSWANPSGATSWEIEVVPQANAPTGTGVVYNGALPYTATGLTEGVAYKYYVRAICAPGNTSEWVGPFNFSTVATGAVCSAPIIVNTLPYSTTNNTSGFGDDFDGAPGTGCGTTGNFLNGNEVVYAYTATFTGVISVNMTGNGANSAMFVYNSCANIGVSCVAGGTGNATTPVNLSSVSVISGTTYYIVIASSTTQTTPYNLIIQQVNCPPPTNLSASNMNATSANLSWNANAATSWEIVVQTAGAGIPAGSGTTTTVNTNYNVTQTTAGTPFAPATAYEYYVRADCGAGDGTFSAWAGPFVFMTTQVAATLNYSEDFEGTHGWSLSNGTQVNKWVVGTATSNGGTHSLYVTNDNGATNSFTINTTSVVHAYRDIQLPATVGQISVSFDWRGVGESCCDYIRVWSVPTTFVPTPGTMITAANSGGTQLSPNLNQSANWTTANYVVNAAAFAGQVRRLIFEWRNDGSIGTQPAGAIDNVSVSAITCSSPSALAVAGITQTSANVSWTAPGGTAPASYDYYLSTTNTAPTAATAPTGNVTTTTAPLTGLQDSTTYYIWVRSNCGAVDGASFWVGPLQFNTLCGAFNVPFYEGFNTDSTTEFCWTVLNSNGDGDAWNMNYALNPFEGNQSAAITTDFNNGNNNDWLISPTINLTGNQRLRYHYRVQSSFEPDAFEVLLSTAGTDPVSFTTTIVPLATYSNTTYVEVIVNLDNAANELITGPVNIAWHIPNGGPDGWRTYIDNVIVEDIPSCPDPTNLAVTNVTEDAATLSWVAGLDETQWQVVVQPMGGGVPTTGVAPISTNPYTVTGLDDSTQYEFYVRAHCADDDLSNWVGPFNFMTTQIPTTLPLNETWEGTVGWSLTGTGVNQWEVGTATANGGTHSLYISNNNGATNTYTDVLSVVHAYRDIQMPATVGEVTLAFDWKAVGESCCDYMRVWLVPASYTPVAGTQITAAASGGIQFDGNLNQNPTWTTETYLFQAAPYAGQVMRLVFEWRNDGSVQTTPPAAVDNIMLVPLTCPAPINLTTEGGVGNEVILSWTPVGTETQWEVVTQQMDEGAPGLTPATSVIVNEPTYSLVIEEGIFYEFYVRAICGPDDLSFWAGPESFSIFNPPGCADVEIFDVDLNVVAPDTEIVLCPEEDNCVPLSATYFQTGETTTYEVTSIDYAPPFPFTGGTELNVTTDDIWSPVVDLPFDFCFFGQTYNEAKVGSNGVVMFGDNMADAGYCPYSFSQQIPNTGFPILNAIYGVYQDINPAVPGSDVSINYQVLGTYPCRALVVNFYEVPQFSCGLSVGTQTSQIVIYEISNIIEVYVEKRTPCTTWQSGRGVIGIQNATGTLAHVPPGRNTGAWSATNEAWRFAPSGTTNVVFEWLKDGVFYSNDLDINVCVEDEAVMLARASYTDCTGELIIQESEVTIRVSQPIDVQDPNDLVACSTGADVTFDLTDSLTDIYTVLDPAAYTFKFYATEADATAGGDNNLTESYTTNTSQPVYVRVYENGAEDCFVVLSFDIIINNNPPTFTITNDLTLCGDETGTVTVTPGNFDPASPDVSISWTLDGNPLPDTGTSITVSEEGDYEVTINNSGCIATEIVTVTVSATPTAEISYAGGPYCSDSTASVPVDLVGSGGGSYSFEIVPNTGTIGTLDIDETTGTINIANSDAGTYNVIYTVEPTASCPGTFDDVVVVITQKVMAAFQYDSDTFCQNFGSIVPTFGDGAQAGNFTYVDLDGENKFLDINPATGYINPATSQEGDYAVTNTIAPTGGCTGDEITIPVTIVPAPIGEFSYGTYCQEDLDPMPMFVPGGIGGAFTATPDGLMINDVTGLIDLSESIPGEYTVTNTVPATDECAATPFYATVVIRPTPDFVVNDGCEGNMFSATVVSLEDTFDVDTATIVWKFGTATVGTGSTIIPAEVGTYLVTVTTPDGCETEFPYDVPSTICTIQKGISPGDGDMNDSFDLTALDVKQLSIFNRYGQEVFSFANYTKEWHGQDKKGNELPTGTYFYSIERENGETKTGWVYINRQN